MEPAKSLRDEAGSDDGFALRNEFDAAERVVDGLDNGEEPIQPALELALNRLRTCSKCVSVLGLFSCNESLEDVSTSALPYLLIPAYMACLTQRLNPAGPQLQDHVPQMRRKIVFTAMNYYRHYFILCRDYAVPGVHNYLPNDLRSSLNNDDDVNDDDSRTRRPVLAPTITDAQRRTEKIKRHSRQRDLNDKIKYINQKMKKTEDADDDYDLRMLYTNKLELWLIRSSEEFELLSRETDILQQLQRACPEELEAARAARESHARTGATRDTTVRLDSGAFRSLLVPIRLLRSEEQKKVFGAGYPSLPKYTIEEYYDLMARHGKLPDGGGSIASGGSGSVTRIEPSITDGGDEENSKTKKDYEEANDDEAALRKARSWDEFKDDNPRGWGNRKNKG